MNNDSRIKTYWEEFCAAAGIEPTTPFQSWHFGDNPAMAEELIELVLKGQKRATAGLKWTLKAEDVPVPDGYSVVTDYYGAPHCVVQTTDLRELPFDQVDADFAHAEGEGDQSLEWWRRAHWDYFSRECQQHGLTPSPDMLVVCERFKLLYPN